jgi:hypothetical protein
MREKGTAPRILNPATRYGCESHAPAVLPSMKGKTVSTEQQDGKRGGHSRSGHFGGGGGNALAFVVLLGQTAGTAISSKNRLSYRGWFPYSL